MGSGLLPVVPVPVAESDVVVPLCDEGVVCVLADEEVPVECKDPVDTGEH